eukprot:TRINITY_DN10813_c0_g4_i2.p1 TRINITY_DN10813_c0_g4~~TRINITY_DN10813_c0_g4_i2.p1  ORF type:complete len:239 (-),score=29.27 TRINITY_DN10813_c0_g4_i2:43-759(-)
MNVFICYIKFISNNRVMTSFHKEFFTASPYKGELTATGNVSSKFGKTMRPKTYMKVTANNFFKNLNHSGVPSLQTTFHGNQYPVMPPLCLKNYKPMWSKRISRLKVKASPESSEYTFYNWHKFTDTRSERKSSVSSASQYYKNVTSNEMIKEVQKSSKEADELRGYMVTRKFFFKNYSRPPHKKLPTSSNVKRMNRSFYYRERVYDQDLEEMLASCRGVINIKAVSYTHLTLPTIYSV